jgi:hypothetical protein
VNAICGKVGYSRSSSPQIDDDSGHQNEKIKRYSALSCIIQVRERG